MHREWSTRRSEPRKHAIHGAPRHPERAKHRRLRPVGTGATCSRGPTGSRSDPMCRSSAARRVPSVILDATDEYEPPRSSARCWVIALAAVAIAWIAFIVLLALFVTTSTASTAAQPCIALSVSIISPAEGMPHHIAIGARPVVTARRDSSRSSRPRTSHVAGDDGTGPARARAPAQGSFRSR